MNQTKDDLTVVFSEETVVIESKEYIIKPWTLKQLIGIWPMLTALLEVIKNSLPQYADKFLTTEGFLDLLTEQPQAMLQVLLPHLPKFFSLSINGLTEEEAGNIDIGAASVVLLKIISKNIGHLKNSLSLVMSEMAAITGAMKNTNPTLS